MKADKVRRLWRGEAVEDINGLGERVTLRTFPARFSQSSQSG